jgi:hypothetical protein
MSVGVELFLRCGVCQTTLKTTVLTSSERRQLAADFHEAHKMCRVSDAAGKAT